ncbi:hypothetical protein DFS34DRAFT_607081 [Phlyctochytrium arcticum]|nr:hypothetical protein DFS34DRAFT_607081 [Phlyctochytrium arcticum]
MLRYSLFYLSLFITSILPYLISIVLPHFRWPNTVCIIKLQFKHSPTIVHSPGMYMMTLPIIPAVSHFASFAVVAYIHR